MTLCNMSIEAGARAAMVAPDETNHCVHEGAEVCTAGEAWDRAGDVLAHAFLRCGAHFDKTLAIDAADLAPYVTWGTNPAWLCR